MELGYALHALRRNFDPPRGRRDTRVRARRQEETMAFEHPSRREVLKTTAALSATASLGVARGRAQDRSATPLGRIDAVLRAATDAKDVPGLALHVDRREGPRAVRPPGDFHCG